MLQHNQLSLAQAERLSILLEECGEVLQVIGKIQRHGFDSSNPLIASSPTNRELLEKEIGDVLNAIDMMTAVADIDLNSINTNKEHKARTIKKWLHHQ